MLANDYQSSRQKSSTRSNTPANCSGLPASCSGRSGPGSVCCSGWTASQMLCVFCCLVCYFFRVTPNKPNSNNQKHQSCSCCVGSLVLFLLQVLFSRFFFFVLVVAVWFLGDCSRASWQQCLCSCDRDSRCIAACLTRGAAALH